MRWLNISYSVWFNRRRGRAGYLFQGRFKSFIVDPDSWGYGMSAYIHLNPVRTRRHGLSKVDRQQVRARVGTAPTAEQVRARLAHLRAFRWSSYRAYAGHLKAPAWLDAPAVLEKGGGDPVRQRQAYRQYVETQVKQGRMDSPWEELQDRVFLGGIDFVANLKKHASLAFKSQATPSWMCDRRPLETVIQTVEKAKQEPWAQFKDRHGDGGFALVLSLARKHSGLTLSELGRKMNLNPTANISMTIKRYQQRLRKDRAERAVANRAEEMLNATICP